MMREQSDPEVLIRSPRQRGPAAMLDVGARKKVGEKAALFVEWIGEFPSEAPASHLLNSGGVYRISITEQIDFHLGRRTQRSSTGLCVWAGLFVSLRQAVREAVTGGRRQSIMVLLRRFRCAERNSRRAHAHAS